MIKAARRVLFLCGDNSCRSQMAEAYLRALGGDDFEVFSAGRVATQINPLAQKVMTEDGLDLSAHSSKAVSTFKDDCFDIVITVCEDSTTIACPVFHGEACLWLYWLFEDPGAAVGDDDEIIAVFRRVRDDIKKRLTQFLDNEYKDGKMQSISSRR